MKLQLVIVKSVIDQKFKFVITCIYPKRVKVMPSGGKSSSSRGEGGFGMDSANQMAANSRSRIKAAGGKPKEESKTSSKMGARGVGNVINYHFIDLNE